MTRDEAVEARHCPTCGARPGQWCGNRRQTTRVHAARMREE